jgi:hypothetical protein
MIFKNSTDYLNTVIPLSIQIEIKKFYPEVELFMIEIFGNFEQTLQKINGNNFWKLYPELLGYDSQLVMITSLLSYAQNSTSESDLINLIQTDYKTFNKENYGFLLNEKEYGSLIFCVD